jgi:imidazolonepropionase-like amidohydrolase
MKRLSLLILLSALAWLGHIALSRSAAKAAIGFESMPAALPAGSSDSRDSSRSTAIRCGRLLDPVSGNITADSVIMIRGDKIVAAGVGIAIPSDATVIDLRRMTVLPGLIDTHTHLTYHYDQKQDERPAVTAIYAAENARKTLEAGFTTVRNLAAGGRVDFDLRDLINRGVIDGPRIAASGEPLISSSGPPASDPQSRIESIRQFVRTQIANGADVIKVFITPGAGGGDRLLYSEQEIRAIVDEAAKAHLKVAAHAHGTEGIKAAIRAGVASVEHGSKLDEEAIRLMIEHHTALVPTLYLPNHYLANRERFPFDDPRWHALEELRDKMGPNFRKALAAGVWIVCGSDAVAGLHGENAKEIEWMVKDGMNPAQAIKAATIDAAKLIGWDDRVGSIEKGKYADMVAVQGDPLRDVTELERIKFVMKSGKVIRSSE